MEGWWLHKFYQNEPKQFKDSWKDFIIDDFEKFNGKIFGTSFQDNQYFTLDDVDKAFEMYMTKGKKILFKPWS